MIFKTSRLLRRYISTRRRRFIFEYDFPLESHRERIYEDYVAPILYLGPQIGRVAVCVGKPAVRYDGSRPHDPPSSSRTWFRDEDVGRSPRVGTTGQARKCTLCRTCTCGRVHLRPLRDLKGLSTRCGGSSFLSGARHDFLRGSIIPSSYRSLHRSSRDVFLRRPRSPRPVVHVGRQMALRIKIESPRACVAPTVNAAATITSRSSMLRAQD